MKFYDLEPGDIFSCNGEMFVKCLTFGDRYPKNAISLADGDWWNITSNMEVQKCTEVIYHFNKMLETSEEK